ncbi:MAG: MoxR family ATPase [Planctomycetaceae bacterium]|nr:MoxR family ATPase [Planctomycetaceae bacterium]
MSPELHQTVATLEDNMARVVLGKRDVVRLCIVALLAGEHILLEDVPGVGKTLIGKALAKSVDAKFCRIQFTPDLLPSDIVGSSVFNGKTNEFFYSQGPIFANIVLADEINRTTPRTQSALLEAMSDNQVSADGHTYPLPKPFLVIATQNPFEFEGTYPLPESQLDRFLLRTSVGYPDREDELRVLTSHRRGEPVEELRSVISTQQVVDMQEAVRSVTVDDSIHEYLLDLVDATRRSDDLHVGVSTRGTLALYRAAQSLAFIEGRDFVIPDDIKRLAVPVLGHRVIAKGFLTGNSRDHVENIVQRLLGEVAVPQ